MKKTKRVPRKKNVDEIREEFLRAVRNIADNWAHTDRYEECKQPDETLTEYVARGTAFSIMVLLDGGHGFMPSFVVAPSPHPDDKAYHKTEGTNWYPKAPTAEYDIAGCLHELLNIHGKK